LVNLLIIDPENQWANFLIWHLNLFLCPLLIFLF
jgi:hypothetical protein